MNWLDIVIIVVVLISIVFGLKRGLIREVFALLALIVGIIIATRSYPEGAKILSHFINNSNVAHLLSFIVIFFFVGAFFIFTGILIRKLIQIAQLGGVDRLGGGVFGFLRGGIIVGVALVFVTKYPVYGSEKWIKDAVLAPFFIHFIESLWRLIPTELFKSIY